MSRPGGTTNAKPIDEQAEQIAQSAKAGIEEKAGQNFQYLQTHTLRYTGIYHARVFWLLSII